MITIQNLAFWYKEGHPVFEALDLSLEPGHIYGLLGKNGVGKTTLLKLISGLSFPKEGMISAAGTDPAHRLTRYLQEMVFVPEEITLPHVTAEEFGKINGLFYPSFDFSRYHSFLEKFETDREQDCRKMSMGQKRKVMLAFALSTGARHIFLDEPANGLDIPSKAALRSILASVFTPEHTVIISTHMVREVENLVDAIVILEKGRILMNRSLEQIGSRISFRRSAGVPDEELLFSAPGEMGPVHVTANRNGGDGIVDLEALFLACIAVPEKIEYLFKS
jgi:ABC-2 type transport system ATP-binding protein